MVDYPEEQRIIGQLDRNVKTELDKTFKRLVALIRQGVPPNDAVQQVMDEFSGKYETEVRAAIGKILEVGTPSAVPVQVGPVKLSNKLYSEAVFIGSGVRTAVEIHSRGFSDARKLALQLFEGYGFRDQEMLKINPKNKVLPQYLRDLAEDPKVADSLQTFFAKLQAETLRTPALRASYMKALDAIENGAGFEFLEKKLQVAFYEKMRYFSTRIARTETHRAFSNQRMTEIREDRAIEFVEVRRTSGDDNPCICELITEVDEYGLGDGVYPKELAPIPPFHPFCKCRVVPRLDIDPNTKWEYNEEADKYFLSKVGMPLAGRIMGSQAKAERVLNGEGATDVYNSKVPVEYQITASVLP
jgi:hypothetical protein